MRYQSTRPKRQFLSSVKCTQCGQIDTTVQVQIFEPAFDEYIECTHCNHTERRPKPHEITQNDLQNSSDGISFVKIK